MLGSQFRVRCIVLGVHGGVVLGVWFGGWGLGFEFQSSDSKVQSFHSVYDLKDLSVQGL